MARNLTYVLKKGEISKRIHFTLEDADGRFDLSDYIVTMSLQLEGATALAVDGATVIQENQFVEATKGKCYHEFDMTTANIAVGTYKGELKLASGASVLYWPVNAENLRTYFKLIVQAPLE